MKYKCLNKRNKDANSGGEYWRDAIMDEHLALTDFQTSYRYILQKISPPASILEAGCGLGRWVIPLARKGYRVTGIEIEKGAIEKIKEFCSLPNLSVIQGDIFKMPFPDKTFDLVLSLGVLEHFEEPENQQKAILEHIRVMKDDGCFFVTVPYFNFLRLVLHRPYIWLQSRVRAMKSKKEFFSEYRYSVKTFKKILEANGLQVIEVMWDDLLAPYSFGLTVDHPLKKYTRCADGVQYKLNGAGLYIQKTLWRIHPSLISGGVGFYCKKNACQKNK